MADDKSITERFWSKVNKTESCWLWTAATYPAGYGCFKISGKTRGAHRVAWELTNGSCGDLCILHKCDVRICVRPDHLFMGTRLDNFKDMVSKGRRNLAAGDRSGRSLYPERYPIGESVKAAKLTANNVKEIRRIVNEGLSMRYASRLFDVSHEAVRDIMHSKTWKHLR